MSLNVELTLKEAEELLRALQSWEREPTLRASYEHLSMILSGAAFAHPPAKFLEGLLKAERTCIARGQVIKALKEKLIGHRNSLLEYAINKDSDSLSA
jgi:hypothetical protein